MTHHHYLYRPPWNVDMKHVSGLRSWIIFGPEPEGISVESLPRCFLLLWRFCTNIYQFTNYWTLCAQAYTNTLFIEKVVYACAFPWNGLLFAICFWLNSAPKHMCSSNTPGWQGWWLLLEVCVRVPVVKQVFSGGKGVFITWPLKWT